MYLQDGLRESDESHSNPRSSLNRGLLKIGFAGDAAAAGAAAAVNGRTPGADECLSLWCYGPWERGIIDTLTTSLKIKDVIA